MNPPQVSCSVNPSHGEVGDSPSTITATATSPDNAQITGYSYTLQRRHASAAPAPRRPWTRPARRLARSRVTVTATDARNLTGSGTLHGGRRSTAATADLQQGQFHPVPGSEETVACG